MTDTHDSTPASAIPRRPTTPEARERLETEFLRLFALRDAISTELYGMADVLNGLDGEPTTINMGGRHA